MANTLDPPASLTAEGRQVWMETLTQIMEAGTMARLDPNSLLAYTSAVLTHRRATALLTRTDILTDRNGVPVENPALKVQREAAQTIATFAKQFRLNHPNPGASAMTPGRTPDGHDGICDRCDQAHNPARCPGHNRQGKPCGYFRGYKTEHPGFGACKFHGGSTASGIQAAAKERARNVVFKRVGVDGLQPVRNPLLVLAELTSEAVEWKNAVAEMVNELPLLVGADHNGDERLRQVVPLLERAMRMAGDLAAEMVKLNIFGQMADLAREQAAAYSRAMELVFHDIELTPEQWDKVAVSVPERFRALEAV